MSDSNEFHDLSELALNSKGQSWGNLGYWHDGQTDYSEACRALALHLGNAAGLSQDSVLFDAGFGCGDQLILWRDHFGIAEICGVNLSQSQTKLARNKLTDAGMKEASQAILSGDINDAASWAQVAKNRELTHVVALDCAYHFPDRKRFVALAAQHLPPGGSLALTDIMLGKDQPKGVFSRLLLNTMLKLSRIPWINIVSRQTYQSELADAGFHDVTLDDISKPVMAGFAHWYRNHAPRNIPLAARIKYRVTAAFLDWACRCDILRFFCITAVRQSD